MAILTVTKPSQENVYSLISGSVAETPVFEVFDSTSKTEIGVKLQKEAEAFFSSISEGLPQQLMGLTPEDWFDRVGLERERISLYLCYCVTAPRLPCGDTPRMGRTPEAFGR